MRIFSLLLRLVFSSLFLNISLVAAQIQGSPSTHSLITYRQYTVLLDSAPQCYRAGCGDDQTLTTASSPCSVGSSCHDLWATIQDRFQPDWCRESPNDKACRIRGWPVLNATAICELVPNNWIFDTDGKCCISDNEPFDIAEWIGDMCNGRWRDPFKVYGGMAREDWQEWIEPVNWTVRPEESTSGITITPHCPSASWELIVFAALNGLNLLLWVIPFFMYMRDRSQNHGRRQHGCMAKLARIWDRYTGGKFQWIVVGIIAAGVHLGGEFLISFLIRQSPGYGHVPFTELAILHGTRPRIQWIMCALALINHRVFANASASFGLCELILQAFGSKYFGVTVKKGLQREFYLAHHLRPFWHGPAAYRMYIGALLWLLGSFFIFLTWFFFIALLGEFLVYCRKLKRWEEAQRRRLKTRLRPHNRNSRTTYNSVAERRSHRVRNIIPQGFANSYKRAIEWEEDRVSQFNAPPSKYQDSSLAGQLRPADTWKRLREKAVYLVLLVGLCSFSAQWIFWDGFVKSMGSRYCPPDLYKIGAIWAVISTFCWAGNAS